MATPAWVMKKPDGDKFWCPLCDEIQDTSEFSHVCNLLGWNCCKSCNKELIDRKIMPDFES